MITFLKILSLIIAAVVGIWASWSDFKEKNKKKIRKTIFIYASLLIILSTLSFLIGDMQESQQELNQTRKFSNLIDSTKQLFDSVKLQMKEQYEDLSTLNVQLRKQNLQLAKQLQANQLLIDQQYLQATEIQERILLASNQAISKIDSSSSVLIDITNKQAKSLQIAENIAEVSQNNLSSIDKLNKEVETVTTPLTNFKIEFTLKYTLNKPLVDVTKLDRPSLRRILCPFYFNSIEGTHLYNDFVYCMI